MRSALGSAWQRLWAVCLIAVPLAAQTGSIAGVVKDTSGAVVPGAQVRVGHAETGLTRQVATDEAGFFHVPLLPVGAYTLRAEAAGFKSYARSGITLSINQPVTLEVTLEVGDLAEAVNVTSEAPLLNTRSSEVSVLMDSVRLTELPLNGRNAIELAGLLPGVAGVIAPQYSLGGGVKLNVTGSRSSHNAMLLDGSNYSELFRNNGNVYPPPDTLREFRVITNNFSAEYGTSGGGVLDAVTRSGTNQLHGNFYEFLRNDNLNARNPFLPRKSSLIQNQFGLTAGGPVVRNKLFYFGSLEFLKVRPEASSVAAFPPSPAEREGDFSPRPPVRDPQTGAVFPQNRIPLSRYDTVARNILARYLPQANQPDGRFITLAASPVDSRQYLIKVDYQPARRHTFFNRFFAAQTTQAQPLGGSDLPKYGPGDSRFKVKANNITSWTAILSNAMVNEFRASFFLATNRTQNFNRETLADLGGDFPNIPGHPLMPSSMEVAGRFNLRPNNEADSTQNQYEFHDNLSWQKGAHSVKLGGLWFKAFYGNHSYQNAKAGRFSFNRSVTGDALADFFLGKPASMQIISPGYFRQTPGQRFGFYFADDWRISPELTLNLGLRYEFEIPWSERRGYWSAVHRNSGFQSKVFPAAPVDMVFPGDPGIPFGLIRKDMNNILPRFGFAYSPKRLRRTVLRGAFGVFGEQTNVDIIQNTQQPFGLNQTYFAIGQLSQPLRGLGPLPLEVDVKNPFFKAPFSLFYPSPDTRNGYALHYNFMLQRELAGNLSVEVGYVGKLGRKGTSRMEVNPAVFLPGQSSLANIEQRRIYRPGLYSGLQETSGASNASYNSLQAQVVRRLARGFTVQGAYTYSKSLDDYSLDVIGAAPPNPYNRRSQWGPSDFDSTHNGNVSFVAEAPKLGNSVAHKALVHHWQLTGIFSASTGKPFTIYSGQDIALSGTSGQTANVVGEARRNHSSKDDSLRQWFNTAAFANPAAGQFGNSGRNNVHGPGRWNLDTGVFRNFPLGERFRFQFRSEFFSIFNHTAFGTPGNQLNAPQNFGRILSGSGSRVIQFALKLYY